MIARSLFLGLLLVFFQTPPAGAEVTELHHDIELALDPEARTLAAVDCIRFAARGRVAFALGPQFILERLSVDGNELSVDSRAGRWELDLRDGPDHTLAVHYKGKLAPLDADSAPTGPRRAVAGREGSFLPPSAGWYPLMDSDRFTYRIKIRVPADQRVVTPGALSDEVAGEDAYRVRFTQNLPSEDIVLVGGPFEITEIRHGGIRMRAYFHPEVANLADDYLTKTTEYLDLYENWIGAYPFPAFHIVSGPLPVGLGFVNITYIGTRVLRLPFIRDTSLGHEVLHNWWGNGVAIDWRKGNWAEGLTTFMADYTYRARQGDAAAREQRLAWLRDFAALTENRDQAVRDFVARRHGASQVTGYNKVAFIFLMLRDEIGVAAFDAAIQAFWREFRFRNASWSDLEEVFEEQAGRALEGFFEQWLDRKGAPELAIAKVVRNGHRVSFKLSQSEPVYDLSVPVVVTTEKGIERQRIRLNALEMPVSIDSTERPIGLSVDPDFELFRRLARAESPPILRQAMLDPSTVTILAWDTSDAQETARALAGRMLDLGRVHEGLAGITPRTPLLIIGSRDEISRKFEELDLPPVPVDLAGRGSAAAWAGRSKSGRSFIAVMASDAEALSALLRPLPHYGRRSYVVFDGSQAIERGIWPSGESPLTVRFP